AGREKVRLEAEATEQRHAAGEERRRNEAAQKVAAEEQARVVESLAGGLKSLSDGDLTYRLPEFPGTYRQIRDNFNGTIEQLQDTIKAIASATREVAGASGEISGGSTDLSQRTEE